MTSTVTIERAPRCTLAATQVRDLLLVALTVSSGAIDAISFLGLGKVFTAFMTGNIVFLGFGPAGAPGPNVFRVVLAIGAFAAGALVASRIVRGSESSGPWPRGVTVALAVTAVTQAAFVVGWAAVSGHPSSAMGDILTAIFALGMGVQSAAIMSLDVRGVFTTAATATVLNLMADLAGRRGQGPEWLRLVSVLVALFAGELGAILLVHARVYAPILPLVVTLVVVAAAAGGATSGYESREGR